MRRYTLKVSGQDFVVDVDEQGEDAYAVTIDGETYTVRLNEEGTGNRPAPVIQPTTSPPKPFSAQPRLSPVPSGGQHGVKAPMPGIILAVSVKVGDRVERGQAVAVLDAMKMHNTIGAPRAGVVAEVLVNEDQAVAYGDQIIRLAEE